MAPIDEIGQAKELNLLSNVPLRPETVMKLDCIETSPLARRRPFERLNDSFCRRTPAGEIEARASGRIIEADVMEQGGAERDLAIERDRGLSCESLHDEEHAHAVTFDGAVVDTGSGPQSIAAGLLGLVRIDGIGVEPHESWRSHAAIQAISDSASCR